MGPGEGNQRQVKIFNRIVTWNIEMGFCYEAGSRHVEIILKQLHFDDAKFVATPGTKEKGRTSEDHEVPLGDNEATNYRALVARCNYLSPDRPNIAFIIK